jgi:hypothetical protein
LVAEQVAVAGRIADKERKAKRRAARRRLRWKAPVGRERGIGLEHLLGHILLRPDLLSRLDGEMISHHTPPLGPEDFFEPANRVAASVLQESTLLGDAADGISAGCNGCCRAGHCGSCGRMRNAGLRSATKSY